MLVSRIMYLKILPKKTPPLLEGNRSHTQTVTTKFSFKRSWEKNNEDPEKQVAVDFHQLHP